MLEQAQQLSTNKLDLEASQALEVAMEVALEALEVVVQEASEVVVLEASEVQVDLLDLAQTLLQALRRSVKVVASEVVMEDKADLVVDMEVMVEDTEVTVGAMVVEVGKQKLFTLEVMDLIWV